LNVGELAINTYDGKIYLRQSGSTDTVQEIIVTNAINTGSINLFGNQSITGSLGVSGDITVLGSVNARQFNIGIISSSILYTSGSTKFGDTTDDVMNVTGSLRVSGSQTITGSLIVTSLTTIATSLTTNSSSFLLTSGSNLIIQNNGLAEITGSLNVTGSFTASLQKGYTWVGNGNNVSTLVATSSFGGGTIAPGPNTFDFNLDPNAAGTVNYIQDSTSNSYVSANINNITFSQSGSIFLTASTGSFNISASFTASLQKGYTWVGNGNNVSTLVATSSFGGGSTTDITSLNTFTSSAAGRLTNLETTSASVSSSISQLNTFTSSTAALGSLNLFSASVSNSIAYINTSTSSLNVFTSSAASRLTNLETTSASVNISVSNLNTYSASVSNSIQQLSLKTGSYAITGSNSFNGNQSITGSLTISQNLIVLGSSSINIISQSTLNIGTNLITVNVQNTASRFGGLSVIDSGSVSLISGSWLFDSINDNWIFIHQNASTITSSVALMGAETYNNVGNETYPTQNRVVKGLGYEHIGDSNITDTGTEISLNSLTSVTGSFIVRNGITGSIGATNGVVSGSAQILTYAIFATTGSNSFNGNQTITGSLVVSGSQVLTGSQTLIGNQIITGSLQISGSLNIIGRTTLSGSLSLSPSQSAFLVSHSISQSATVGATVYGVNIIPYFTNTTSSQTQTALRVMPTFTGSFSGSNTANIIADFGATSVGSQFTVTDVISGSIYMVNDVSGLPIIEALSDGQINMYDFPYKIFNKSGSYVSLGTNSTPSSSVTVQSDFIVNKGYGLYSRTTQTSGSTVSNVTSSLFNLIFTNTSASVYMSAVVTGYDTGSRQTITGDVKSTIKYNAGVASVVGYNQKFVNSEVANVNFDILASSVSASLLVYGSTSTTYKWGATITYQVI
jgi:hypothetical protein